jgi:hypothetical protein
MLKTAMSMRRKMSTKVAKKSKLSEFTKPETRIKMNTVNGIKTLRGVRK